MSVAVVALACYLLGWWAGTRTSHLQARQAMRRIAGKDGFCWCCGRRV